MQTNSHPDFENRVGSSLTKISHITSSMFPTWTIFRTFRVKDGAAIYLGRCLRDSDNKQTPSEGSPRRSATKTPCKQQTVNETARCCAQPSLGWISVCIWLRRSVWVPLNTKLLANVNSEISRTTHQQHQRLLDSDPDISILPTLFDGCMRKRDQNAVKPEYAKTNYGFKNLFSSLMWKILMFERPLQPDSRGRGEAR